MLGRDASSREVGPIRITAATGPTPAWSALLFTLLAGLAVIAGGPLLLGWGRDQLGLAPATTAASSAVPATPTAVPTAPAASALASAWIGQSGPPVIVIGDTTTVAFRFRNAGMAEWHRGTPSEVRLGIVGRYEPALAHDWPYPERPAVQAQEVVRPGEIGTFRFGVRGHREGVYRLHLRPVVDGVAWLTDQGVYVDIEVR